MADMAGTDGLSTHDFFTSQHYCMGVQYLLCEQRSTGISESASHNRYVVACITFFVFEDAVLLCLINCSSYGCLW
ncbi:hypothetical protein Dda3937_04372 [Dickeya dadantii 3937]|uniref:Uncharacterized protein n=1 Tax=Dickeya dadantii (strain 3937) TaxID=198628 RepID=E0SN26_DICD3|nr:hypothetical protein Dda3937_04372 [Dickeya dadantii 3937]